MRCLSSIVAIVVAVCLFTAGCVHEQVPWPPTPGDITRINDAAEANSWFRVEYVEPLATAQGVRVIRPVGIVSADDDWIAFRNEAGAVLPVPTPLVKGVTVKERAAATGVGASVGLAWGALAFGGLYLLSLSGPSDPGAPQSSCNGGCVAKTLVPLLLIPMVVGAFVGYLIGGRRTFDLVGRGRP
ncbi:MAG TPA: hypothetical protein VN903_19655 [Polyangia bacterium]|jgi:hypothetical protein|nr:hypothetical protein [Polyangia bacterium]